MTLNKFTVSIAAAFLFALPMQSCSFNIGSASADGTGGSFNGGGVINGSESDATLKKIVKIGKFSKIDISQGIRVVFTQGPATGEAKIATTPSAEKFLVVKVEGNTLICEYRDLGNNRIKGPSIIHVQAPALKSVNASSGASFKTVEAVKSEGKLNLDASSGARITFGDIECLKVDADASSGASVALGSVDADMAELDASSGGSVSLEGCKAEKIDAEASSGASVHVNGVVAERIVAEASSAGAVSLSGKCNSLRQDVSSGGRVRTSNLRVSNN